MFKNIIESVSQHGFEFIFQSKSNSEAWAQLEDFIGENYPTCIKKLLLSSGYNKLMMLAEIDEAKLLQLEEFINNNRSLLTTLKCCYSDVYRNQTVFSFLPGHRATILNIKSTISRLKEAEKNEIVLNASEEPPKKKMRLKKVQDDNVPKKQLTASLSSYPAKKLGFDLGAGVIPERNNHDYKVDLK